MTFVGFSGTCAISGKSGAYIAHATLTEIVSLSGVDLRSRVEGFEVSGLGPR
jgi:hypothetical protein